MVSGRTDSISPIPENGTVSETARLAHVSSEISTVVTEARDKISTLLAGSKSETEKSREIDDLLDSLRRKTCNCLETYSDDMQRASFKQLKAREFADAAKMANTRKASIVAVANTKAVVEAEAKKRLAAELEKLSEGDNALRLMQIRVNELEAEVTNVQARLVRPPWLDLT
jgi:wobble nucleotide-excising tRNase